MDYNIIEGKCELSYDAGLYSGTLNIGYAQYKDNGIYICKISDTNGTTTPTLNLNGIGAKTIVLNNGGALSLSELFADSWCLFMYSAGLDKFLLVNSNAGSASSLPYTSYVANIFYQGEGMVPTVLYNNTGKEFSWTFELPEEGDTSYRVAPNVAFTDGAKVAVFTQLFVDSDGCVVYADYSGMPNYIDFTQKDFSGAHTDNTLDIFVELRIYN